MIGTERESITCLDCPPSTIEGFADIKVNQNGKVITLRSYKYPANTPEPKAVNIIL